MQFALLKNLEEAFYTVETKDIIVKRGLLQLKVERLQKRGNTFKLLESWTIIEVFWVKIKFM